MSDSQRWLVLAGIAGTGLVLYWLAPVFSPFLTAALLAYLGDPLVDRLERLKLSRTPAVVVVFLGLFALLALVVVLVIPLVERQISYLIGRIPAYIHWLNETAMPWLRERLGVEGPVLDVAALQEALRAHWQQAGGLAAQIAGSVSASGGALLRWLTNLVLIPVVTFYLLRDWDRLIAGLGTLVPRRFAETATTLARDSDEVLGAFLRGQLLVMLGLGIIYSAGLWLIGLELALLIGMLAGLVSFVPYLGFILGVLAAGVAVGVQSQEWLQLVWVLAVFGVGQLIEGTVLTPLFVGDRIGLHPVAVIFAVLAGGQLFGFVGVLLALPVAAVLAVVVRHTHARYTGSDLYRETGSGRP